MQNNKNNITLSFKNIISFLKNLTDYFTDIRKIITLSLIILTLSFINIILNSFVSNSVFTLSYESEVDIGFTFNPTLSVSISSPDLIISNLTPGSSSDSNSINVVVATNASYGYTLSVNASSDYLTHSNNIDTFSSIATDADLSSLEDSEDNNIWGYSTSLDNGTTWSNYNGLSSSSNTALLDKDNNSSSSIDFKIRAKAGSTQPSGTYTNTINFIAVSKVAPMSLLDSFIASGAEQLNGYYKMQDMTHDICQNVDIEESELQLIDIRDNKIYWVAKLKDDNCWMTQNLDLDLSHEVALTSETSDINPESYGTTIYTTDTGYTKDEITGVVSWLPSTIDNNGIQRADTIDMIWNDGNATAPGWTDNYNNPYSANPGNRYRYTNSSTYNETMYTLLQDCANTNNNDISGCQHTHFGNYYNWPAAVASNNTNGASGSQTNSVCPKNWSLSNPDEYRNMLQTQKVYSGSGTSYASGGFNKIRTSPLYFARFGNITNGKSNFLGDYGMYQTDRYNGGNNSRRFIFNSSDIWPDNSHYKSVGYSVRCLAE